MHLSDDTYLDRIGSCGDCEALSMFSFISQDGRFYGFEQFNLAHDSLGCDKLAECGAFQAGGVRSINVYSVRLES